MNISDLLGAVMQSGMTSSSHQRMRNALGGGSGNPLEALGGLHGGHQGGGGGLGEALSGMIGGGRGLGGLLGGVLDQAGQAVGGKQNLAVGGLGALAGALLGGGGKSMGGALGGGVMALLGAMAFKALKGSGQRTPEVPLGLMEPQNEVDRAELERHAEMVLKAMINAAKADGQIDDAEIERIVGKLKEMGVDAEMQRYVMKEMNQPMQTEKLLAAGSGRPELAAEMYAASLLAIEVDTPAEKTYMQNLSAGLKLDSQVVQRIQELVGLQPR